MTATSSALRAEQPAERVLRPDTGRRVPAAARRAWRGPAADPAWARPALLALLAATSLLYVWDLSSSGWANSFYAAAVQAGTESWKAFFFGSSDAANSITVDKPPASLWPMALSARLLGLSSFSVLLPQALMGVASVAVLHAAVRRVAGPAAGLLAGAVLATTPIAAVMFRFDNPDALLVLLMTGAAWAITRALDDGRTRWLVTAGVLLGLGFLTKQLQVLVVLPPLAGAYLLAGPPRPGRRVLQLLAGGAALVASAGWWIAAVTLWPASSRPYIGGSQTNSILELTLGYNGLGRLTGEQVGSVTGGGGGGNGGGRWGESGITRLLTPEFGGQASWLLPTALLLLVAGLALTARRPRTDRLRAALVVWGGWLVVHALVFSYMQGIIHPYYTVALAPALGGVVGLVVPALWSRRATLAARGTLAVAVALTAGWAFQLLGRSAEWQPWLRPLVLAGGLAAAVGLALAPWLGRRAVTAVAVVALVSSLAAPAAATVATAAQPHTGSIPSASPSVAGSGPGGGVGGGAGGMRPGAGAPPTGAAGAARGGFGGAGGGGGGGAGGLLDASTPSAELVALLRQDAASYTWVAAAVGSQSAAGPQLATGLPVMALGGFNGSDPSPTLAQFQQYVAEGSIHYLLGGSGPGRSNGGSSAAAEISSWVAATFPSTTVGGTTVYDLTVATGGTA